MQETTAYGDADLFYSLGNPSEKQFLTTELEEISGLTYLDSGILGCIQDEEGIFFKYDFNKETVVERIRFHGNGDFEGVEIVGDRVYAIESNGDLRHWNINETFEPDAKKIETPLSSKNDVEGLGYLEEKNYILMACKGDPDYDDHNEKGEAIYVFDIDRGEMLEDALFTIEEEDIEEFIEDFIGEKIKDVEFNPSAIALHPLEERYYVMASSGNLLVILNADYEIENVVTLDPAVFRQPEGICFAPDGTMYISSEGRGFSAFILKFDYAN